LFQIVAAIAAAAAPRVARRVQRQPKRRLISAAARAVSSGGA
jgi:hypothetical protein